LRVEPKLVVPSRSASIQTSHPTKSTTNHISREKDVSGHGSDLQPVRHHMLLFASNLPFMDAICDVKRCAYPCRRIEGGHQAHHRSLALVSKTEQSKMHRDILAVNDMSPRRRYPAYMGDYGYADDNEAQWLCYLPCWHTTEQFSDCTILHVPCIAPTIWTNCISLLDTKQSQAFPGSLVPTNMVHPETCRWHA
jgi:hypothetical protein